MRCPRPHGRSTTQPDCQMTITTGIRFLYVALGIALISWAAHADDLDRVDMYFDANYRTTGMDNDQLLYSAQALDDYSGATLHRPLNTIWLDQDEQQHYENGRALGRIAQLIFKSYWRSAREQYFHGNTAIPDSDGRGKVGRNFFYTLKVTNDETSLMLKYPF